MTAEQQFDFDLFVIGGGSGGRARRPHRSPACARVGIAEGFRYGGTCVIRGCVPKKLLVFASRFPQGFAESRGFGWEVPEVHFDWKKLVAAKNAEITRLEGPIRATSTRPVSSVLPVTPASWAPTSWKSPRPTAGKPSAAGTFSLPRAVSR